MDENVLEQLIGCWQSDGWGFIFCEQVELIPRVSKVLSDIGAGDMLAAFENVIACFPEGTVFANTAKYYDLYNFMQTYSYKVQDEKLKTYSSKYNSNSEPSHTVTDIRYLSSDDELIYYEFKPVRIPETGMMYKDWNCYDSFKIYITDFDALLFKTIDSVFPVNDPDPNGYGVQKCFDKCSNNFFRLKIGAKLYSYLQSLWIIRMKVQVSSIRFVFNT